MSLENEKSFNSRKLHNGSKKIFIYRSNSTSMNNKNKKNVYRPQSQKVNKRNKVPFGTTALQNARRALEQLREKKEEELYSRLQYRIKSEFLKYKTSNNYQKKQNHFNDLQNALRVNKQNDLFDRQLRQTERYQTHYFLNEQQKKCKNDKINNYKKLYIEKENQIRNNINNRINERLIEKQNDEEIKTQEVKYKLKLLNLQDKRRRYTLDKKMREKDEERRIKKDIRDNERKNYLEQKNIEKSQEISYALDLIKQQQNNFNKKYELKEKKEKEKIEKLNLKKQKEKEERELNNYYRMSENEYRLAIIKNTDNQRNHDYYNKLKIIQKNKILIQNEKDKKNAERKQMIEEKNDYIQHNLDICQKIENNFRQNVKNKIIEREKITEKLLNDKKLKHLEKVEENKERSKEKEYVIKQIELNDSFKRNEKRKKLDKKKDEINDFLYEKQMINNKKVYINDNLTKEHNFYSNNIDELMYKRPMDKAALNDINNMVSNNPKLAGLTNNI